MNKLYCRETFIVIDILLSLILIYLIFIIINSILTKDYIGPSKIDNLVYLKVKLSNIH